VCEIDGGAVISRSAQLVDQGHVLGEERGCGEVEREIEQGQCRELGRHDELGHGGRGRSRNARPARHERQAGSVELPLPPLVPGRTESPTMRTSSPLWTSRSAMAVAAAAPWNNVPQSLKARLVVTIVEARR